MATILQAEIDAHHQPLREIFWEYLVWANDMNDQTFGIRLDIAALLERDMATLQKFMPPDGRLLLAQVDSQIAGCVCLKALTPTMGEVKRLYVRPAYRGQGIAKSLITTLLDEARQQGYTIIRLDSARFMTAAHALYRSFGFQDIEPYPESEIPAEYHRFWVFMEKKQAGSLGIAKSESGL